jgi:hypothetical protein
LKTGGGGRADKSVTELGIMHVPSQWGPLFFIDWNMSGGDKCRGIRINHYLGRARSRGRRPIEGRRKTFRRVLKKSPTSVGNRVVF